MQRGPVVATLGNGVIAQRSHLADVPATEFGLFATKPFRAKEFITEYDGDLLDWRQAQTLRAQGQDTHLRSLHSMHSAIDGREVAKRRPFGRGGGALANDCRDDKNNALMVKVESATGSAPPTGIRDRIFLQAIRDIALGDEITVSYGKDYWRAREVRESSACTLKPQYAAVVEDPEPDLDIPNPPALPGAPGLNSPATIRLTLPFQSPGMWSKGLGQVQGPTVREYSIDRKIAARLSSSLPTLANTLDELNQSLGHNGQSELQFYSKPVVQILGLVKKAGHDDVAVPESLVFDALDRAPDLSRSDSIRHLVAALAQWTEKNEKELKVLLYAQIAHNNLPIVVMIISARALLLLATGDTEAAFGLVGKFVFVYNKMQAEQAIAKWTAGGQI